MKRIIASALLLSPLIGSGAAVADQLVVLDFDTFTDGVSDDGKDHVYSPSERIGIVDMLNHKFGEFPVTFTDVEPGSGLYSKIFFNTGLSEADDIDFQNKGKADDAAIHIPKLLEIAGVVGPYSPMEIIPASVNIAAHETLHLLGTRHHDSFLSIGGGVPSPFVGGGFDPDFPGPSGALLGAKEFNSLTTSIGFSAAKLLDPDLFIGPRSAVKLLHEEFVDLDVDSEDTPMITDPQFLTLKTIPIPNHLPPADPWFGRPLSADVAIVEEASLGAPSGPADYYEIFAMEGDIIHIEVLSEIIGHRLGDTVDPAVALLDPEAGYDPVPWFSGGAVNFDERESTDAFLWDVAIEATGLYVIEVFADPGTSNPEGEYELLVYRFHAAPIPEPSTMALFAMGTLGVTLSRRRIGMPRG